MVTTDNEIKLNGYKYKLVSPVRKLSLSQFPAKISIGNNTYDNQKVLSSWNISGERGIGIEEMDEVKDVGKIWFTDCITGYKNHLLPPRLATKITAPTDAITTENRPATAVDAIQWDNESLAIDGDWDTYSEGNANYGYVQNLSWSAAFNVTLDRSRTINKISVKPYCNGAGDQIRVYYLSPSGYVLVYEGIHASGTKKTYTFTAGIASGIRIQIYNSNTSTTMKPIVYEISYDTPEIIGGTPNLKANFNGDLYVSFGKVLAKLDTGRTSFEIIAELPETITALIPSLDSKLYIFCGDATNYFYMTTAEVIAQTDVADAYYGWQFDNKLLKCNSTGTVTYCANPDTASPTWSAAGTITDIANQIERFFVARDSFGSTVSYCATNSILKVLDLDTPEWLDTEVRLPSHPNGGKGAAYFNGRIYLSYGLGVKEYNPETGFTRDIGLTERDGLPIEYNGEIVKLLGDSGEKSLFALVDASQTTGDSKSGVYSWFNDEWHCWWLDTVNNQAMHDAIVSPAQSAYALYWGCGADVYYIDIPRGINNPDKITQNYATSGVFITPWFDAANGVAKKLAKSLQLFCTQAKDTMSITAKYRIDHEDTDLDTDWTTLDTISAYFDDFEWGSDTDDIDTSGGTVTWSKTVAGSGTAKITTDQAHTGTRSLEIYGKYTTDTSTAYFTCEAKNGVEISFWVKPQSGGVLYFYFSSATKQIYASSTLSTDWTHIEIKNIDWDAGTFDKYINDVKYSGTMTTGTYTDNQISFVNGSLVVKTVYIDDLEVTEETFRDIKFASGAGLPFRAIQFRLDFTSPGTTVRQDIKSLVLYFKKEIGESNLWAWDINIKIDDDNQYTAKQKYEFLESAKESDTDILFSYHPNENDERYVQISSFSGTSQTGRRYDGVYSLRLIES